MFVIIVIIILRGTVGVRKYRFVTYLFGVSLKSFSLFYDLQSLKKQISVHAISLAQVILSISSLLFPQNCFDRKTIRSPMTSLMVIIIIIIV